MNQIATFLENLSPEVFEFDGFFLCIFHYVDISNWKVEQIMKTLLSKSIRNENLFYRSMWK